MSKIKYTSTTRATPGACGLCGEAATQWHRSTARCGLVVAARCCDAHEDAAKQTLRDTTVEMVASAIPACRRSSRAASAVRRADRLDAKAGRAASAGAAIRGASSACHTLGLHAAAMAVEADALRELAAALTR